MKSKIMANPDHLNPFVHLPNCDNGSYNPATYQNIPCDEMYGKIIPLCVHFNFLFIISTTAYFIYRSLQSKSALFPPSDVIAIDEEAISKQRRVYSLRKWVCAWCSWPLDLVFHGAAYQVFVTSYTCDIYLWDLIVGFYVWTYSSLWRTLRLHMLIRYNALQQRYLIQQSNPVSYIDVNGERMTVPAASTNSPAETSTTTVDLPNYHRHDYSHQTKVTKVDRRLRLVCAPQQALNVSTPRHIMYVAATMVIVALVIVCIETLVIWDDGTFIL